MADLDGFRAAPARSRLGIGAAILLVLVALAVTIGIGIWRGASAPVEVTGEDPVFATETAEPAVAGEVYVHVSGQVQEPGIYVLAADARVVDAVAAAGGFAEDALSGGVNLARPVTDGEQLVVPKEGEDPPPAGADPGTDPVDGTVNLNTADAVALEALPGIGPALAQRILDWRTDEGPFGSVDDLLAVSGIGPSVLEGLREQATV
ncbi:ComEA family DNA-binding protein [Microbacterium sp. G2-8]|uniref:ComEA family DNA-binding protein n=1 Tax=Microbacterium sp. G2-8 TaxID=2842454 RepID=UPI001C8A1567|nr:ComEA family DNA-binding protein [Microbacterium sp. G2-8]